MSLQRIGLGVALFAALSMIGCQCNQKISTVDPCGGVDGVQPDNLNACTASTDCASHYSCNAVKDKEGLQCCVYADRKCNTEADCCPGQTCPADRKKCFDKYLACDTDADCGDKGDRFCEVWTDHYGASNRCRFHACDSLGQCPSGQSCFKGECMADLPCSGACDPGKACVPSNDRCQDYACPASCAPGFIATFKDNRDIWDTCNLPNVACECAELPGLNSGDMGRFSAAAADPAAQQVVVSLYDGEYGDLVVRRYDTNGSLAKQQYVDGVPSGTVKYGPSGARGGIVEPGEDVGRYTDVAVSSNTYVSYYDVSNGNLKLAYQLPNASNWTLVTVDGLEADLGLYSSVAVDSDGLPGISYFQKGGSSAFNVNDCPAPLPTGDKNYVTALKFARANTPTPTSAADFTIVTIACQDRPAPDCNGCTQTCADPGTGTPGCYAPATTCSSCDPNTEACVTVGTQDLCAKKYNPSTLNDVLDGVGLFSATTFDGKDAYVAYMKRTFDVTAKKSFGRLYGVKLTGGTTRTNPVLLDGTGDTGFFPDIKIDPQTNNIAISYHDFSSRKLKFWTGQALSASVTPEVIDPGAGPQGSGASAWVGTDSALVFTPSGKLYAVYQDATNGDLKVAARNAQWEVLPPLRTEGAVGFFADGVSLANKLYATHARIHARLVSGEPKVDNTLLVDSMDAP